MISFDHHRRLVSQGRDEMMTAYLRALDRAPNEAQQRDASHRFTTFMEKFLDEIVGVVAVGDYPAFGVKLENIDGKGKIALKAIDVDEAGPALITRLGSSLTLVLTDAAQFDQHRTDAQIELDQRPLPLETAAEDDGEDFADEAMEIVEAAPAQPPAAEDAGPLFTVVEDEPWKLADGTVVRSWTVLHGPLEIFAPISVERFANAAADKLNELASELGRGVEPHEVRNSVESILRAWQENIGIAFHPPYSEAVQDNAPPAVEEPAKPKRGAKSAVEKVEAYFAGYDGAASDLFTEDCPHERGSLKDNWIMGLEDAKAGNAPRWNRPTPPAANDDGEPRESTGNVAA